MFAHEGSAKKHADSYVQVCRMRLWPPIPLALVSRLPTAFGVSKCRLLPFSRGCISVLGPPSTCTQLWQSMMAAAASVARVVVIAAMVMVAATAAVSAAAMAVDGWHNAATTDSVCDGLSLNHLPQAIP